MLKWNSKVKKVTLLLLSLLIVVASVGVTLAYIVERSEEAENTFTPVLVDSEPVATTHGRMAVKNTGDVAAYLRAAVIVTWVSVDGEGNATGGYHASAPLEGVDYNITYDTTSSWQKGTDGYWYYTMPVEAGRVTMDLITAVARLTNPPEGYALSVEIVTTGIQTTPVEVVEQAWNVTVNGTSIAPN